MKHAFKYQPKDILGRLNIVGFALLFYGAMIGIIFFQQSLTKDEISSLLSTLLTISGSYHSVKSSFPYEGKRHPTFVLKGRYLFRHLLFSIKEIYSLQIKIVSIGIIFLLIIFPGQYIWITLSVLAILLYWLSLVLTKIYKVFGRILHLLTLYGMYAGQELFVFTCLCLNIVVLVLNFKLNYSYAYHLLSSKNKEKLKNISLLKLVENLVTEHLAMMIVLFVICASITYLVQKLLLVYDISSFEIPVFFLSISTYITLLDVLVGKEMSDLGLDKSLVVLQFLNKNIDVYKAYRNSQSLFFAHILVLFHTVCLVGLLPFLLEGNIVIFVSNVLMVPFIYFISYCYFVKSVRIVGDNLSVLRWLFLVLYLILVIIATVGDSL